MTNPITVPVTARTTLVPVRQRAAAQHRQRAEHHPEPVLDREDERDQHGQGQTETGAQAVAHGHRAGRPDSRWSARSPPLSPSTPGRRYRFPAAAVPSTRAHTGRASAAAALAISRPVTPIGGTDGAPAQQGAAELDGGVVVGLREDVDDVLPVAADRDRSAVEVRCLGQVGAGSARSAGRVIRRTSAQSRSTRTAGSAHRAEQSAGVTGDPVAQPLQVVDHADQGAAARRQGHRPVGGAEEVGAQCVHRGGEVGAGGTCPRSGRPARRRPRRRAGAARRGGAAGRRTARPARRSPARSASRAAVRRAGPPACRPEARRSAGSPAGRRR